MSLQKDLELARWVCVGFAVMFMFIGVGLNSDKHVETLIPNAWIWIFAFCALSVMALGIFWTRRLLYFTGILIPSVFLMRIWASIDRILGDPTVSSGRVLISIGLYGMLMLTTMTIWGRIFPRVVEYREFRR